MHTNSQLMFSFCCQSFVCARYIQSHTFVHVYTHTYTNSVTSLMHVCMYYRLNYFFGAFILVTRPRMNFVFCVVSKKKQYGRANKQKFGQTYVVCARKSIFSQVIGDTHSPTQYIDIYVYFYTYTYSIHMYCI